MITIPYYDLTIIPGVTYYFQKDYLAALTNDKVSAGDTILFVMLREDRERDKIQAEDIYPIGVCGTVEEPDEEGNIGVRTGDRVDLHDIEMVNGDIDFSYTVRPEIDDMDETAKEEHLKNIKRELNQYVQNFQWGMVASRTIAQWSSIEEVLTRLSGQMHLSNDEKFQILSADRTSERISIMEQDLYEFITRTKIGDEAERVQTDAHEAQYREEAIKKQIDILQRELDAMHPENITDVQRFRQKIQDSGMNPDARGEAEKVLNRLEQEGSHSAEYGMLYDYLEFVTSLSWKKEPMPEIDLEKAEEVLDSEHYGMKKPKTRIIQQLAVMKLNGKQSGSILLFVGAPGTGKTSIGQSVADALGRKYCRVSLGGVRDEAEIRGHRRTYIGAMPGRIMEAIKRTGVSNPVMVLDEVDKLTKDYNGDPSSALLEVLDPEQNNTFTDHYMNVPYDLSDVLFICTANTTDTIPEPLLNRMEVIEFQGYTETEKVEIGKRHLLPKAMKSAGLKASNLRVSDDTIRTIVEDYTMEAGVRGLKKQLDTLCRVAAVKLVKGEQKSLTVSPKRLSEFLDSKPIRHDRVHERKQPGIVTGLAWTQAGGDILFIETMLVPGSGKTLITGQLGDVMKESVEIAITLVKNLYPDQAERLSKSDLHVHVPAGSVPKDGPSAGITLTTALASLISGREVDPEIAMTGEVSLQGNVMPIGGLPEKLMAAVRAGVKKVFIPTENQEDLEDVAAEVKENLEIVPVHTVKDVLTATGVLD